MWKIYKVQNGVFAKTENIKNPLAATPSILWGLKSVSNDSS